MNQKYLTVDEAAALTRLSRQTLYRRSCERSIPTVRVGGRLLFPEDELREWIDAGRRPVVGTPTRPAGA